MKRNCSFSPVQVGRLCTSIACFSLFMGTGIIHIFTAIEILVLIVAVYVYSRHALDHEKITIVGKQLLFERSWGGKIQSYEFNTIWTKRIRSESTSGDLVLKTSTKEVPIGFLSASMSNNNLKKSSRDFSGFEVN